jgi:hypothetical protein
VRWRTQKLIVVQSIRSSMVCFSMWDGVQKKEEYAGKLVSFSGQSQNEGEPLIVQLPLQR